MENCFFPSLMFPAQLFSVYMLSPYVIYNQLESRTCKHMVMCIHTVIPCPDARDKCFDSGLLLCSQNQTTQQACLVIPLNPVIMILEGNHKKRGGFGSSSKHSRMALAERLFIF